MKDYIDIIRKVLWQAYNADDETVNPTDWGMAMDALAKIEVEQNTKQPSSPISGRR